MAGAMPPAGTPTIVKNEDVADYAHDNLSAHPELLGTVIQFEGPLTVTNKKPDGLVETVENDDGSTKTNGRGFEITGGIWVDDDAIYAACIKTLPDGTPDLTNGIRGVWERYNDFYGGTAANPAPTYSVLKPLNCDDIAIPAP
jgi:hypothetical protein